MAEGSIDDVLEGRATWALVLGDCRDVLPTLPDKSVAHVITDPPYSEHTHAKVRRGGSFHAPDCATGVKRPIISTSVVLGFDALDAKTRAACALHFARVATRWTLAFSDAESVARWGDDLVTAGVEHVRTGAWVKLGATPQFTGDRPGIGFEAIEIAHPKGRKRWNGGGKHAVWTHPVCSSHRVHTTQKPLSLMLELIADFTDPGDLVLDAFAGSSTTGVACRQLGRRYIGIERVEAFYVEARARMRGELAPTTAGQTSIFDALGAK